MKKTGLLFTLSLIFIAFNSCQNSDVSKVDDEITLSLQDNQTEEALSDIDLLVNEAIALNTSQPSSVNTDSSLYLTDCPVITKNNESSPKVITIDFGVSCTGKDGKVRSGKIIVSVQSSSKLSSIREKTFENYYVDGKKIDGSVINTIEKDTVSKVRTTALQEDVTITFPDNAGSAHRVSNLTRQYQRNNPKVKTDDQTISWGTVEITRVSGVKLTKTIAAENPLVYKADCQHIVSGVVTFTTSDNRSWTIDYGNGDCDDKATITKNGKTKEITIK